MSPPQTFTGRSRERRTGWTVRAVDWIARTIITVGGIGTIVAVLLVCVFLAAVVVPLFSKATVEPLAGYTAAWGAAEVAHAEINDYQTLGWAVRPDGTLQVFRADTGTSLKTESLVDGTAPTLVQPLFDRQGVILGFPDGTLRIARIHFQARLVEPSELPESLRKLEPDETREWEGSVLERTSQGLFRAHVVAFQVEEPLAVAESPIVAADLLIREGSLGGALPGGESAAGGDQMAKKLDAYVAVLDASKKLQLVEISQKTDLLSNQTKLTVEAQHVVPLEVGNRGAPKFVVLTGRGDNLYVAWPDGTGVRFNTRDASKPAKAQEVQFVEPGATLTALQTILGRTTLVAGDDAGRLTGWFIVRRPAADEQGNDILELVRAKTLPRGSSAVTSLTPSARNRTLAVGFADGRVSLFQMTSAERLASVASERAEPVRHVLLSPKNDGLYALAGGAVSRWKVDMGYPEASFKALFGKIWYEGYPEPAHVWQSTGGSDTEPKFGLMPLVFGSLKATLYSMLFGAPLALLAALYTSEFLDRQARIRVKPVVELMASLPSVVLGFLAALVFAPVVARAVPAFAAAAFTIPATLLFFAYLWQLLPSTAAVRLGRYKLLWIGLAIPAGMYLAALAGPFAERVLFAGDFFRWLDGRRGGATFGSGWGGWLVLCLPLSALLTGVLSARVATPRLVRAFGTGSRFVFAGIELGKFAAAFLTALLIAVLLASLLSALGFDPRGSFVGTYVQRNALIVGFVMGFAIIPLIYTIADDALVSVPESLRSASLGAGATPWQTAIRIVIPTAMSGLFSALMIGLGRAVGETMIVLMAGGNTPQIDWNPFNGFQTLSATIATEIADAERGSTHYRTLFLAGLTLFALTFLINTVAEIVRLRFRRRVYQL